MKIEGEDKKALWFENNTVKFIDQRKLPYEIEIFTAKTVEDVAFAIKDMVVRGAPAIGVAAAYGMVLGKKDIDKSAQILRKTRPTAHDLFYAIDYMLDKTKKGEDVLVSADNYCNEIIDKCRL